MTRYTKLEGVIYLDITSEQTAWQQEFVQKLWQEKRERTTLRQRVEQRRRECKLDEMYTTWALREP